MLSRAPASEDPNPVPDKSSTLAACAYWPCLGTGCVAVVAVQLWLPDMPWSCPLGTVHSWQQAEASP